MFKLVLCALFAVVAAKPGELILTPQLTPFTTYLTPGTIKESFINQGPLLYSSPLGYSHYIKKRSPQFTYITPTTYFTKPAVATYSGPLGTSPIWPASLPLANAHFIKKRSAQVLGTSYIDPTYTAPWTSTLTTSPLVSSSWIAPTSYVSQPFGYGTHLIKKRSAPAISYAAPAGITYQSRFDLHGAPIIKAYGNPYAYSAYPAYTHVI